MIIQDLLSTIELLLLDFDGVMTDNTVIVHQDGTESVRCWRSDGLGLSRLKKAGIPIVVISTEVNPVVQKRCEKLQLRCIQGVEDKASTIIGICKEMNIETKRAAFVGNDINDIPAFKVVGIPIGVADSYPEVHDYIMHRTDKPGGLGAVREICDMIADAVTASSS